MSEKTSQLLENLKSIRQKRRITLTGINGDNFFAHAYETADGRWFDRSGLPCAKPGTVVTQSDEEVDQGDDSQ